MSPEGSPGAERLLAEIDRLEALFAEVEPRVHAFLPEPGRRERLRRQARELLTLFPAPAARPPLFGLPVGIKDVFHAAGFPTAAGSRLPPAELQGAESPAVTALVAAGALILGKTVSTEFAYFAPGPTENPHAPGHTPGGSSSGSAAAVGAGLCPLALGTQTIGSVGRPAAFCGVVGFKPSYDRISREGMIPLAPSLDHIGVLAADVDLARRAAAVLIADWQEAAPPGLPVLGIPRGPYLERASEEGRQHFEGLCRRLADTGFEVRQVPSFEDFEAVVARHYRLLAGEVARVHGAATSDGLYPRFRHLYHPRTVALIEEGQAVSDGELTAARAGCRRLRQTLGEQMEAHGIDLWISPPAPGPAPRGLASTGDPVMNLPWTQAGLPTLVLPAGRGRQGLPLGLQLTGGFGGDEALLAWGHLLEETVQ